MAGDASKNLQYHEFFNPVLQALRELGDSGSNQEIHNKVVAVLGLSDEQVEMPHKSGQSSPTMVNYRLGWARTWLKHYGLVENPRRGVWALTQKGRKTEQVDPQDVIVTVTAMLKKGLKPAKKGNGDQASPVDEIEQVDEEWRDTLRRVLKNMNPFGFERLCQRLLRESGFIQVEVTSASHDGGIDGWGVLQVNDFMTFRVEFQCKRYSGSVGPDVVQKLRGAMAGSADRGLIITTGTFTKGAAKEASHEHKSLINLVDGEQLIDKLKELELGVKTEQITTEKVTVDESWFAAI